MNILDEIVSLTARLEKLTSELYAMTASSIDEPLSFEELRGKCAEMSRSGHTAHIKATLQKYGVEKLSDLKPEDYTSFIEEVCNA